MPAQCYCSCLLTYQLECLEICNKNVVSVRFHCFVSTAGLQEFSSEAMWLVVAGVDWTGLFI